MCDLQNTPLDDSFDKYLDTADGDSSETEDEMAVPFFQTGNHPHFFTEAVSVF